MTDGQTSLSCYEVPELIEILINGIPAIQSIKLFSPPIIPPIQEDSSITAREKAIIAGGLSVRDNLKLPFWDSVFLYLSNHPVKVDNIIRRATLHNQQDSESFFVSRAQCTAQRIRETISALPVGRILAVSSKVLAEGSQSLHIPMLDFHCARSKDNDGLVTSIVKQIGIGGFVVASGRSYHFYGRGLIDESSLVSFLGKSLLFCPIVDRAWVAHQLLERACGLRVSPGKEYPSSPKVILEVA